MLYTLKLFSSAPIILYSHRNTEEKKIYKIWIFPSMVKRIPLQHLNPHFYIIKSVLLSPLIHHLNAPNTNWVHVFYFLNIIDRWCPNAYVHYKQTLFLPISDTQEYPELFVRTREIGPRTMKNGLVLNITILLYDVLWNIFFQELVFFITAYICSKAPFKIFIFGRPKTVLPRHQQSLWLRGIAVKNNNISCKTIKVFSFRFITQSSTFYIV